MIIFVPSGSMGAVLKSNCPNICAYADNLGFVLDVPLEVFWVLFFPVSTLVFHLVPPLDVSQVFLSVSSPLELVPAFAVAL